MPQLTVLGVAFNHDGAFTVQTFEKALHVPRFVIIASFSSLEVEVESSLASANSSDRDKLLICMKMSSFSTANSSASYNKKTQNHHIASLLYDCTLLYSHKGSEHGIINIHEPTRGGLRGLLSKSIIENLKIPPFQALRSFFVLTKKF